MSSYKKKIRQDIQKLRARIKSMEHRYSKSVISRDSSYLELLYAKEHLQRLEAQVRAL